MDAVVVPCPCALADLASISRWSRSSAYRQGRRLSQRRWLRPRRLRRPSPPIGWWPATCRLPRPQPAIRSDNAAPITLLHAPSERSLQPRKEWKEQNIVHCTCLILATFSFIILILSNFVDYGTLISSQLGRFVFVHLSFRCLTSLFLYLNDPKPIALITFYHIYRRLPIERLLKSLVFFVS